MRALAVSCVLLYAVVGFVAGACTTSPSQPSLSQPHQHHHQHQPNKPAAHPLACAWACHASANPSAIDFPSQFVPIWFAAVTLFFLNTWIGLTPLVLICARPPPLFSIS
jgi:hypothetical protein